MDQPTLFETDEFDEDLLHKIVINFGKHNGVRLVHVPMGYLRFIVTNSIGNREPLTSRTWGEIAGRELTRRGYVNVPVTMSGHAIDDFSRRGLKIWWQRYRDRQTTLGLVSFLQELFAKDVKSHSRDKWVAADKGFHLQGSFGIRWTFLRFEIKGGEEFEVISIWVNTGR